MPVEADQFDRLGLAAGDAIATHHADESHQHDDSDRHVHSVETGESVETRTEETRREAQALAVEGGELVHLAAHEGRPEERRHGQPQVGVAIVAAMRRRYGEHHRERTHEQHERAHRRERDVVDLIGLRTGRYTTLVEHVGGDESTEQQTLGSEEDPHAELVVRQARRGVVCAVIGAVGESGVSQGEPAPSCDRHLHRVPADRNRRRAPWRAPSPSRTS